MTDEIILVWWGEHPQLPVLFCKAFALLDEDHFSIQVFYLKFRFGWHCRASVLSLKKWHSETRTRHRGRILN